MNMFSFPEWVVVCKNVVILVIEEDACVVLYCIQVQVMYLRVTRQQTWYRKLTRKLTSASSISKYVIGFFSRLTSNHSVKN